MKDFKKSTIKKQTHQDYELLNEKYLIHEK